MKTTEKTITENNKMIAEFMGYPNTNTYTRIKNRKRVPSDDMQFNTSWDWLMPVVGKISEVAAGGITYDVQDTLLVADIEKTYNAVVEFIEWYNERNKAK